MQADNFFREDYASARDLFIRACRASGAEPRTWAHPIPGPDGLALSTESAYWGDPGAAKLLVLISGVHGVETLCGSGCQSGSLTQGLAGSLPRDTALLMVHAINPWGAAHLRRNNEDNVDLCRNFLDFSQPLPVRPIYEDVHAILSCPDLHGPRRDAADRELAEFRSRRGIPATIEALMGGQYQHADGFGFGGHAPVWSNRIITRILQEHGSHARHVCLIEYHSGLGPYAYGTTVTMHTGEALQRARRWYGEWVLAPNERKPGDSGEFFRVQGHSTDGYVHTLPSAQVTSIVLEYGTYAPFNILPVMLQDHWLAQFGDATSAEGRAIRAELLRLHYPQDVEWRQSVWERSQQVIRQSLRGLSAA